MPARSRPLIFAALVATALVLFACTSTPEPAPTTPQPGSTATVAPIDPSASPDPEQSEPVTAPADVTCESLLGEDLVTELTDQGWTAREDPFFIGDVELADGISCTWGDFEASAGDDLLLFAWSPISTEQATAARAGLTSEGWLTEEGPSGTYVTEDPSMAIAVDAEGYGMTYLFGDGWVTLSDTKQGLVLIQLPG